MAKLLAVECREFIKAVVEKGMTGRRQTVQENLAKAVENGVLVQQKGNMGMYWSKRYAPS